MGPFTTNDSEFCHSLVGKDVHWVLVYICNGSSLINVFVALNDTQWVWLLSAIVFTLNPNERQINTKTGFRERLCGKSRLRAHIIQRGLQNPITFVNKLTFARIMPLCPPAYFLGRTSVLQGLNKPLNIAVIALKSNVHWAAHRNRLIKQTNQELRRALYLKAKQSTAMCLCASFLFCMYKSTLLVAWIFISECHYRAALLKSTVRILGTIKNKMCWFTKCCSTREQMCGKASKHALG